MQVTDTPAIRKKIAIAKEYSDRVKSIYAGYHAELTRIWGRYLTLLKSAVQMGGNTSRVLDALISELYELLSRVIEGSVTLACEREEVDRNLYSMLIPLAVAECNVEYYEYSLSRYEEILQQELAFAMEYGLVSDMELFLSNPTAYAAGMENGLFKLKEGISSVEKGVSYSFADNMKKLGLSVAALAFTNAEYELWKSLGGVDGYFGVRNSSYPCSLCDSYAYQFIPLSQGMIYPLHNRCVCSIVPLRQSELQE